MDFIAIIDEIFIHENNNFNQLIALIKKAFADRDLLVPPRHHHDFPNPKIGADSSLLLMPAWNPGKEAGVKIVTVSPENTQFDLPSIQGTYIYLDAQNGTIKGILDAKELTVKRTAATSALASTYLSREESSSLLMIGTGALSANLIKAHASVRPIKKVFVWGRHFFKAKQICELLKNEKFEIYPIKTIEEKISEVDIISCATLSQTPLVLGQYLQPGQFVDLVGAYKKDMREADDEAIVKSEVFVDTYQGGLKESGDIVIPLNKGLLKTSDIRADLFELCRIQKVGRKNNEETIIFKSVGHALEDLAAANYFYQKYINQQPFVEK